MVDKLGLDTPSSPPAASAGGKKGQSKFKGPEVPERHLAVVDLLVSYPDTGMVGMTLAEAVLMVDKGERISRRPVVYEGFACGVPIAIRDGKKAERYEGATLALCNRAGDPPKPFTPSRIRVLNADEVFALSKALRNRYLFTPEGTEETIDLFSGRWPELPRFTKFCKRASSAYLDLVNEVGGTEDNVTQGDLEKLLYKLAGKGFGAEADTLDISADALGLDD